MLDKASATMLILSPNMLLLANSNTPPRPLRPVRCGVSPHLPTTPSPAQSWRTFSRNSFTMNTSIFYPQNTPFYPFCIQTLAATHQCNPFLLIAFCKTGGGTPHPWPSPVVRSILWGSVLNPQPSGTFNVLCFHCFTSQFMGNYLLSALFSTLSTIIHKGGGTPPLLFHTTILFSMTCFKINTVKTPLLCRFSLQNCHFCGPLESRPCAPLIPGCVAAAHSEQVLGCSLLAVKGCTHETVCGGATRHTLQPNG